MTLLLGRWDGLVRQTVIQAWVLDKSLHSHQSSSLLPQPSRQSKEHSSAPKELRRIAASPIIDSNSLPLSPRQELGTCGVSEGQSTLLFLQVLEGQSLG